MLGITIAHDATSALESRLPAGQACGYTTGSGGIAWTAAQWSAHPGAVRICQDASASDDTADVLDVERGAADNTVAGEWFKRAMIAFNSGKRPGQRMPAMYTSFSNVTPLVNALIASGVTSGPHLFVADWSWTEAYADTQIMTSGGPFPICAVQLFSGLEYDTDVISSAWLAKVSSATPLPKMLRGLLVRDTLTAQLVLSGDNGKTWQ